MKKVTQIIRKFFSRAPLTHPTEIYKTSAVLQSKIKNKVKYQKSVNFYGIEVVSDYTPSEIEKV